MHVFVSSVSEIKVYIIIMRKLLRIVAPSFDYCRIVVAILRGFAKPYPQNLFSKAFVSK